MTLSPRVLVVAASALAVLGALLLLLMLPVSVSFDTSAGEASVACGTAFTADPVSRACPDAQTTRQWWGFGLLAAGVAGGVGGLVVPRVRARR